MHNDRIIDLGEDLRNHTFETLDAEPEITGEDAGKIAAAVERAFVETIQTLVVFQIDDPIPLEVGEDLTVYSTDDGEIVVVDDDAHKYRLIRR